MSGIFLNKSATFLNLSAIFLNKSANYLNTSATFLNTIFIQIVRHLVCRLFDLIVAPSNDDDAIRNGLILKTHSILFEYYFQDCKRAIRKRIHFLHGWHETFYQNQRCLTCLISGWPSDCCYTVAATVGDKLSGFPIFGRFFIQNHICPVAPHHDIDIKRCGIFLRIFWYMPQVCPRMPTYPNAHAKV